MTGFKCPICKKEFRVFWNLVKHFNQSHRLRVCPVCGKHFKSPKSLLVHLAMQPESDLEHMLYYGLWSGQSSGKRKRARKYAYESCQI